MDKVRQVITAITARQVNTVDSNWFVAHLVTYLDHSWIGTYRPQIIKRVTAKTPVIDIIGEFTLMLSLAPERSTLVNETIKELIKVDNIDANAIIKDIVQYLA